METEFLDLLTLYIYMLEYLNCIILEGKYTISNRKFSNKEEQRVAHLFDVDISVRLSRLLETSNITSKFKLKEQDITSYLTCDKSTITVKLLLGNDMKTPGNFWKFSLNETSFENSCTYFPEKLASP